jgi:hypothetical protein
MGIENTALDPTISCNQSVMNSPERCVQLLCEKRCHASQRQPMPALLTGQPLDVSAEGCRSNLRIRVNF